MSTRERVLRAAKIGAGLTLGALVAATVWTRYQRATTETVPYTVVARLGEVELRRYPRTVAVETVAPSENKAFSRLFRYIAGGNEGSSEVSMTAPVEVDARSASIDMTTPVEVDLGSRLPGTEAGEEGDREGDDGVRMAFYLPAEYDPESAPTPTDDRIDLRTVPERTLAVKRFTGRPTTARISRERDDLLSTLADADVTTVDSPFFLGYDAPWTVPWSRRNEVAVEVETERT
jgi:hypothetical protein